MSSGTSAVSQLKTHIKLGSKDAQVVYKILEEWRTLQLLTPATYTQLRQTLDVAPSQFDWNRLAKYTSRLALVFMIIAVISLVFESEFLQLIRRILNINPYKRAALTAAIAASIHFHAWYNSRSFYDHNEELWMYEAVHTLGALVLGLAALQLAEAAEGLDVYGRDGSAVRGKLIMLALAFVYAFIGYGIFSTFIWSCSMLLLGVYAWFWQVHRYVRFFLAE